MTNETVSRCYLQAVHQAQISRNENNDDNSLQIIRALGGIDNLLDRLLGGKSIDIAQNELNCIHKIITNQTQYVPKLKQLTTKIKADLNRYNQNENSTKSVFILEKDNTYLRSYFGEIIANKILNVLHHTISGSLLIILTAIWMVWYYSIKINTWYCIYTILCSIYFFIYGSFYALSINKNVFGKIVKTMDFWIQSYYWFVAMGSLTWYKVEKNVDEETKNIYIAAVLLFTTGAGIIILIIVSFDGYPGIRKYKILLSGFLGIVFFFGSIFWQFMSYANGDDSIVYIYNDIGFSRFAQSSNGFQIVSIFMFKQCIFTYYFKKQAAVMVTHPFLIWINAKSTETKVSENLGNYLNKANDRNIEIITTNVSHKEIEQNTIASIKSQNNEESISSNNNIDYSNES
eukprot:189409_1